MTAGSLETARDPRGTSAPEAAAAPRADDATAAPTEHTARIGERLRRIRRQQGLSLADVEERSDGVWKAVVVGAYERGDRAVSIPRLAGLADFYGIPLSELLPGAGVERESEGVTRVVLDLTSLAESSAEPASTIARFAGEIQHRRSDHNGRVLTLREADLDLLALTLGTTAPTLVAELREQGILRDAAV